jgi:hypothetical protein
LLLKTGPGYNDTGHTMQRFLAIFGHWLHSLSFAIWLGGIFAIGAIAAPAAFRADRLFAGRVVTESFQKLNTVSFVCAALMLGATWLEWRVRDEPARRLLFVRAALTAAAVALALFLAARLIPSMLGFRSAGQKAEFERLHQISAIITQAQAWLLIAGAAITSYLALPRAAGGIRDQGSGIRGRTPETPLPSSDPSLIPDPRTLIPEEAKRP